jgi:hypothetical protein
MWAVVGAQELKQAKSSRPVSGMDAGQLPRVIQVWRVEDSDLRQDAARSTMTRKRSSSIRGDGDEKKPIGRENGSSGRDEVRRLVEVHFAAIQQRTERDVDGGCTARTEPEPEPEPEPDSQNSRTSRASHGHTGERPASRRRSCRSCFSGRIPSHLSRSHYLSLLPQELFFAWDLPCNAQLQAL